jgi:hypothetical protein
MNFRTRRCFRLTIMFLGGVITRQNFRTALNYPFVTVTGRNGIQHFCCRRATKQLAG